MMCKVLNIVVVNMVFCGVCFLSGCKTDDSALKSNADLSSKVTLDPLFSDNMVLQRSLPIKIRGWAKPGALVNVSLGENKGRAVADTKGVGHSHGHHPWWMDFPIFQA